MPGSTRAEPRRSPRPAATALLPHDLLELGSPGALVWAEPPPAWVGASLARAPFVVVRRAARRGALVPVGVRGERREERFAAWLAAERALRCVRPEDLAAARRPGGRAPPCPALDALDAVAALLGLHGLRWGPVGGVGFELATGVPCTTPASDLDVVIRAPAALDRSCARRLHGALAALPVRVDVQLEAPGGAVALAEYAGAARRVVLRTLDGPRLCADPWAGGAAR